MPISRGMARARPFALPSLIPSTPRMHASTTPSPQAQGAKEKSRERTEGTTRKVLRWTATGVVVGAVGVALQGLYHLFFTFEEGDPRFDGEKLYANKSTQNLAFNWFILKMCSYDVLVNVGTALMMKAEQFSWTAAISHWFVKKTIFKHFVAGETQEETMEAVEQAKKAGMGVVLDYSIEAGGGTKEELDKVAEAIISTIHLSARDPTHAFACLKVSGLTSFDLLDHLSRLMAQNKAKPSALPLPQHLESSISPFSEYGRTESIPQELRTAPPNAQELNDLLSRLDMICAEAKKNNVPILFDAEQVQYQPAIDALTIHYSKKFNKPSSSKQPANPIVYNTYQMYLVNGPDKLREDIKRAKAGGYTLGVKLVRGAYMYSERQDAETFHYPDPICPNIEATHANYYKGLELAFANLDNVSIMIATHNEDTVLNTMKRLRELKIDPKGQRVLFAQLYGMGDHLSVMLAQNGFRVFKYVPYGPIEYVIPYLVRRMQENRGFIGSASRTERNLLYREFQRRVVGSHPQKAGVAPKAV